MLVEYLKKKLTASLLNKVSVSRYKSKNLTIPGQPRFQFLAKKVGEIATILGQPDAFEMKYTEFLCYTMQLDL